MKERPILFNGPMVRAILEGGKTVTRRVAGSPPAGSEFVLKRPGDTFANTFWNGEQWETQNIEVSSYCLCHARQMRRYNPPTNTGKVEWYQWESSPFYCPYGKPGDRLWVRESFAVNIPGYPNGLTYRADHHDPTGDGPANPIRWRPSIHMPRWASRITLEITGVEVRPLWRMAVDDMIAEGVPEIPDTDDAPAVHPLTPFIRLWDSINARRGYPWSLNPWVWVINFKRIESEES